MANMRKWQEVALEEALDKLEAFADPEDHRCAVHKAAREESRLYITTWVIPRLREVLGLDERGSY